jgi:hypothetical protein
MEPEKEKPKVTYYIFSKVSQDPVRDFQQLLLELKSGWVIDVIQNSQSQATLSNNMGYSADLSLIHENPIEGEAFPFTARLTLHPEDASTFNAIRRVLWRPQIEYHLYSQTLTSFLPKDPELLVEEIGDHNKETYRTFEQFNLKPIFFYQKTSHYYVLTETGSVHLVNPYLLNFLYMKDIPEKQLDELSYEVSPSLKLFVGMFEKGLIPTKFYEYFNRHTKIINKSFINIGNPGRKVFVKPLIFEFDQENFEFYTYAGDSSSSLLMMDKIREGQTLNDTIIRVLKDELKIADDYVGALVQEHLEFDRDKEGKITPRIIVMIYVNKIKNREWAQKMSQTSWRSLDRNFASEPDTDE